jgi:hypothetical protein
MPAVGIRKSEAMVPSPACASLKIAALRQDAADVARGFLRGSCLIGLDDRVGEETGLCGLLLPAPAAAKIRPLHPVGAGEGGDLATVTRQKCQKTGQILGSLHDDMDCRSASKKGSPIGMHKGPL